MECQEKNDGGHCYLLNLLSINDWGTLFHISVIFMAPLENGGRRCFFYFASIWDVTIEANCPVKGDVGSKTI